jgi:hypothetical protein
LKGEKVKELVIGMRPSMFLVSEANLFDLSMLLPTKVD